MKIRIAVAADPTGAWNACGWAKATDADMMSSCVDILEPGEARYWLEAEIPDPQPAPTLTGTVTEAK